MDTTTKESPILQSAILLCEAVAAQPDFQSLKQKLDAFLSDEMLKFQYQQVNDLNNLLQMKQSSGLALKDEEIAKFEELRAALLKSPVVTDFIEAQEQLRRLHLEVGRFLDKTFEIGRKPEYEDVFDGSCPDCRYQ
jgi:cell fate (sporulation/competence/biofilm development) regulator YlbF (YheA/YmcA/DUF963 family)